MPRRGEVEETVTVVDNSRAPGGYIEQWDWTISPSGNYNDDLSNDGGTITFNEEGYFTVRLVVIDNNGNMDNTSKKIRIEDNREPPKAYFRVSEREISYGGTIEVTDESTPGSAPIADWDWDIQPSVGVTENLDDAGGTIKFDELGEYEITLTVEDDNGFTDDYSRTIDVINMPPEADFDISTIVLQGQDVIIKDESELGDSDIDTYDWMIKYPDGADESHIVGIMPGGIGDQKTIYFDKEGVYTLQLTITDVMGDSDTKEIEVTVEPAVPVAGFNWDGYWKQNRLVTLTNNSVSTDRYPIDTFEWYFTAVSGGARDDAVKIDEDCNLTQRRVIFKEPGNYSIKLKVTNKAGHSDSYEEEFEVREDRPPEADLNIQSAYLRDPNNFNIASIQLKGNSISPDGDTIAERNWRYKYDSDNDGSFSDETWVSPGDYSWAYIDSSGNRKKMQPGDNVRNPIIETKNVGKYYVELEVVEGFGQPTISKFINNDDILKDNTLHKPMSEKTGEVINARPSVGFNMKKKKKADIVFTIGEIAGSKITDLQGLINRHLKAELDSENVDYGTIQAMETTTFSSNDSDAEKIFNNWSRYGVNQNTWFFDPNTNKVQRENNDYWSGFYDPNFAKDEYTLELKMGTFGGDNDDIGISFGIQPGNPEGHLAFLVSQHGSTGSGTYNTYTHGHPSGMYIYKGDTIEAVERHTKQFENYKWHDFKAEINGNHIKIWFDGDLAVDYHHSSDLKGSFGFFTNSQPNGAFKDITVTAKDIKTLDEVLKEPNWRDDALRFLVNLSDIEEKGLNDENKAAFIYSRLLNDEIDFSVLGTNSNRTQAEDAISKNDGNGKFVYNNNPNMEQAIQEISSYIINKINDEYCDVLEYALLNEEVIYETFYNDNEGDPKFDERWKYEHDPFYFENSMGEISYSGQWKSSPIYRFGKVGEFLSTFQAQDNPKDDDRFAEYRKWSYQPAGDLRLKVHRRPVAAFSFNLQPIGGGTREVKIVEDFEDTNYQFNFLGDWLRSSNREYGGSYSTEIKI